MVAVKTLEIQMDAAIRDGLRKAMQHIDVTNFNNPLTGVEQSVDSYLHDLLFDQILKTHSGGYASGGDLIRQHIKIDALPTATPLSPLEDQRIRKATEIAIEGLKGLLNEHEDEIKEVIRIQYEEGASTQKITTKLKRYFDDDRVAASRFARTITNDVYNRAHVDRYKDSGVVGGMQFSAHIDENTSDICRMLNGTIWALDDKSVQVPPLHFNCRSRVVPYFGTIPGARDFDDEFGSEFVGGAKEVANTFQTQYWTHTDSIIFQKDSIRRAIDAAYARIGR